MNERRGRGFFLAMVSMMGILSGPKPQMLDVRHGGSTPLHHLKTVRSNSIRTRNARLTAIRSLFSYAALRHPEHAQLIAHVLAIPPKRFDKRVIAFLTADEVDALLAAPDTAKWEGRRDRVMMTLAVQTGLRVSELTGLDRADITLGIGAHVRCEGKGRKQRAVPLSQPLRALLHDWMAEQTGHPNDPLFHTRTGRRLSRDAIALRISTHARAAAQHCPSLASKKIHPHTLRHSCAMSLLQAGVDTTVIALWLGHSGIRSTDAYVHAYRALVPREALTRPEDRSVRTWLVGVLVDRGPRIHIHTSGHMGR